MSQATRPVICDGCGKDITTTGNCDAFRLVLASERIPSLDGIVTLMHVEPEIAAPLHFCGIVCLKKWGHL